MPIKIECKVCSDYFEVTPSRKDEAKYCSTNCYQKWRRENKPLSNNEVVICDNCNNEFKQDKSVIKRNENNFCDRNCYLEYHSNRTMLTCENCSKDFSKRKSRAQKYNQHFCSNKCRTEYNSKEKEELQCKYCDQTFIVHNYRKNKAEFCSKQCHNKFRSNNQNGSNNPNWQGGYDYYYGKNWKEMRKKALQRDNYKCCVCKRGKEETGRQPDVHHIKPVREFDKPENANYLDNLVTLCKAHHVKVEGWGLKPDIRNTKK